jgi:hypothetical protein
MARVVDLIPPSGEQKYFCKEGWTPPSTNCPSGKSLEPFQQFTPSCSSIARLRDDALQSDAAGVLKHLGLRFIPSKPQSGSVTTSLRGRAAKPRPG